MHGVLQIEMCGQRREIVSIVVHIVAAASLGRAAMSTAIMGDHAKIVGKEEQHLRVPIIARKRPAMAENDGLARAPILY